MIVCKLKNTDGKELRFDTPEKASDIKLSKKIDFDVKYEELMIWISKEIENQTLTENRTLYVHYLCKILSEFYDCNFSEVLNLDISSLIDDTMELSIDKLNAHIEELNSDDEIDLDSAEETLLTLFNRLYNPIMKYHPKLREDDTCEFVYKDQKWLIPKVSLQAFTHRRLFDKISVVQAVNILEIKRFSELERRKQKNKAMFDPTGSVRFTQFLRLLSILCHKEGEQFPLDDVDVEKLIEERTHYFKDITMDIALDVSFFLTSIGMI